MEKLDLTKILAGCPKGTPLYSSLHGNVTFDRVKENSEYPIRVEYFDKDNTTCPESYTRDGRYFSIDNAECILFPSKTQRDWSRFKRPQEFAKGDHILWRNNDGNEFFGVFDQYTEDGQGVVVLLRGETISDWDVYIKDLTKLEKFDPKLLKTGGEVLVRNSIYGEWNYALFSHLTTMGEKSFANANSTLWNNCIPYNCETKHLIGTTDDAPEFYNLNNK